MVPLEPAGPGRQRRRNPTRSTTSIQSANTCVPGPDRTTKAISYVDFVKQQGRSYETDRRTVPAALIGSRVGTVRCSLGRVQPERPGGLIDGDAGALPAGTGLYAVTGYPTSFRLAARLANNKYVLYDVSHVPAAERGEGYLPLTGKVKRVDILDAETRKTLIGRITNPTQIRALPPAVNAILVNAL